jgi:hypothetical protein
MILEAVEDDLRSGGFTEQHAPRGSLSVEHVLPQEWHKHWPLPAGADADVAEPARDRAKHTIGNLTLVTHKLNPAMSNAGWQEKRKYLDLTVMRLSSDIRDAETWDEETIAARGDRIAARIVRIWPGVDAPEWR